MTTEFKLVALKDIIPDPNQPRQYYDQASMDELTESVKSDGVLSPILLRKTKGKKYMIVFGERRFRAATEAGLKEIPAMIREMTDEEVLQAQIVENLQRKDVHPMEEAIAFQTFIESKSWSIEEVAKRVGKSNWYVKQRLRLNSLIDDFQKLFYKNAMSITTAMQVCQLSAIGQESLFKNNIDEEDLNNHAFVFHCDKYLFNRYTGKLIDASFDISDKELVPVMGACTSCQHNTAIASLFPDSDKTAKCTNLICFNNKSVVHFQNTLKEAKEDPTILFVASYMYGQDSKDLDKLGVEYLGTSEYSTIYTPELPDLDDFKEDFADGDFDTEEEMMKEYQSSLEQYKLDIKEYEEKIATGKYKKAFVLNGDKKGKMIFISLSKGKASNLISGKKSVELSDKEDIDEEISRLQSKEERSKQIDENKAWDEIKVHFKPYTISEELKSKLTGLEMKAISMAMYNKLDWKQQEEFRKLFKIDGRSKEFPTPDETTFNQMQRFFFLDVLPPSYLYSGYTEYARVCLEVAEVYFPDKLNEIKLKYEAISNKRVERVEKRIAELKVKKLELQASQKTKSK